MLDTISGGAAQDTRNPFRALWDMGYEAVLPVVPPNVKLHPDSFLFRRLAKGEADPRGKAPGKIWRDDLWGGFKSWTTYKADELDLRRWNAMGASVGLRVGDGGVAAIDADALTPEYATLIAERVQRRFGVLPTRVGRKPKTLWLLRSDPELSASSFQFGPDRKDKFEILAGIGKKQCVVHGVHPFTHEPYRWTQKLVPLVELPFFPASEIEALIAELRVALPNSSAVVVGAAGTTLVDQESLKGELDTVRRAVEATPNTNAHFQSREAYRDWGYAIKASLADHPREALELWLDWCARWEDGDNDPEIVRGDWERMSAPYRRGKGWLYRMAEEASSSSAPFSRWTPYLETPDPRSVDQQKADEAEKSLFGPDSKSDAAGGIAPTPVDYAAAWAVGPRAWLYGNHYIRQFLSSTIAQSKVGKTSLILAEAIAMASGKPILGVQPAGALRVWVWNGEDPLEELWRRIQACMRLYGLTPEDMGDRLFVDSGRRMPIVMATQAKSGAVIAAPVVREVTEGLLRWRIDVMIVDPFISSHRVTENDNNAIDLVTKQWAQIADVTRCAIETPHHSKKLSGAEVSVEDGRGASALLATVRASRSLARATKREIEDNGFGERGRRLFRFTEVSSNLAIPAASDAQWMELGSVNLENGKGDDMDKVMNGDSVGVARVFDKAAQETREVGKHSSYCEPEALQIIGEGGWAQSVLSATWVGIAIARAYKFDPGDKEDKAKISLILRDFYRRGLIRVTRQKGTGRKKRPHVELVKSENTSSAGLFD